MVEESNSNSRELKLGLKGASVVLLTVLLAVFASDYGVVKLLDHFRSSGWLLSPTISDTEFRALDLAIDSVLTPWLVLGVTVGILKRYFPTESFSRLLQNFGFGKAPSAKVLFLSLMCGVGFVLLVLNPLLQYSPPTEFVEPHPGNVINAGGAWAKLSLVLAVILFAPVSEEFLFRGVLYQTIAQSTNRAISALVVSSIFIALHPDALRTGYWVTHAILYTFPFVLVALREATGSIHGPILAHAGFNAVEIFI